MPGPAKAVTSATLKYMTKAQRETFATIARLSPGKSRPWLLAAIIVGRRIGDYGMSQSGRSIGQVMAWAEDFLWRWEGWLVERKPSVGGVGSSRWRLTRKAKHVAKDL